MMGVDVDTTQWSLPGPADVPRDRSKKHPDNLIALWEELDGKTEYPMEDLIPQCAVAHAMAVSEGRRGYR